MRVGVGVGVGVRVRVGVGVRVRVSEYAVLPQEVDVTAESVGRTVGQGEREHHVLVPPRGRGGRGEVLREAAVLLGARTRPLERSLASLTWLGLGLGLGLGLRLGLGLGSGLGLGLELGSGSGLGSGPGLGS